MRSDITWVVRLAALGTVLLFSIIVLGLSANYVASITGAGVPGVISFSVPSWASFALAVSIITLISLGPMVVIDFLRRGAITSWILVELSVLGFLWVMWLASAADTTSATGGASVDCSVFDNIENEDASVGIHVDLSGAETLCRSYQAIQAFAWLNWLILMAYTVLVLVLALIHHNRGNTGIWRTSVRDNDFFAGGGARGAGDVPMTTQQDYKGAAGMPNYGGSPQV